MPSLVSLLADPPPARTYCLAYSGGLDSSMLLHLAQAAGLPRLCAVHVHHGLQADADRWAAHCVAEASALGVHCEVIRVQIDAHDRKGPEAAARAARYAAIAQRLPADGVLVTAHHQRDQAETLLLRLLRGTGVQGLAAMASVSHMPAGGRDITLWRPLLTVPRAAIEAYAAQQGLRWLDDPHNHDARYARSHLRQAVMPALRARWPGADAELARAAAHAADAAVLLEGLAQRLLEGVHRDDGSLAVTGLLALGAEERRLVLRHWLLRAALPLPSTAQMQQLEQTVLRARAEANPLLRWPGVECRRHRDALHASAPLPPLPSTFRAVWDGCNALELPAGYGRLMAPQGLPGEALVRFAQGGEKLRPEGDRHTRSTKKIAQDANLAPWLRPRLPLIFIAGQLVSIAGRIQTEGAPRIEWQAPAWPGLPLSWRHQ